MTADNLQASFIRTNNLPDTDPMIITYCEQGWTVVTQRSHGLLAAQICGHWRKDMQPQRWIETLIATAEHDDENDELADGDLISENGGPKNFKMKAFDRVYCDSLLSKSLAKGRYIGVLISMHIRFLYAGQSTAKSYCTDLSKKEKLWIEQAQTTREQVKASYELLEFCDALSLIICQDLMQPENRKMEISTGPDGTAYQLSMADTGAINITPWPFEEDAFHVNYESRIIKQLSFKSSAAFRKKLQSVPVQLKSLKIVKS
jgi:hypothetical protein